MPERKEPLKKGDEVYIKEWDAYGKVLLARPANIHEPEEDGYYQVQVDLQFFHRDDLKLDTSKADDAAREIRIVEKVARRDVARNSLQRAIDNGSCTPATWTEYLGADDEVRKEKGLPSFFRNKT